MSETYNRMLRYLYQKKMFYDGDNLTGDVDCSLHKPWVLGSAVADVDFYAAKERRWQSAPCISTLDGKTLFCTFSGDNYGGDEQPNNYNVIMGSADGGVTWKVLNIIDHPEAVRMHEPILWFDGQGVLWHFWAQSYNWWDGRGGVWAMKAEFIDEDEESGLKVFWSEPRRLCDGVMATTPITLTNGDIMLPVSIWKNIKSQYHSLPQLEESSVYVSKDGGETFIYVGGAYEKDTTFDENAIVERADGSLYMIMRCEKAITASVSEDGGSTWSEPVKVMDHTSSRSFLAKFPSGNYVLVTNDDPKIRSKMTAFLSTDQCQTWSAKLLLDEKFHVSYPAGCITADGRVHVGYDFNRYIEEEIYYASFTEEDILAGQIVTEGSFLKRLVSKGENGRVVEKVFESGD